MRGLSLFLVLSLFCVLLLFGVGAVWVLSQSDPVPPEPGGGLVIQTPTPEVPPVPSVATPRKVVAETRFSTETLGGSAVGEEVPANAIEAIGKAWGVALHDRTGKSPALDVDLRNQSASTGLPRLAKALDLALVGQAPGEVGDVYLTPHAVYTGSNEDVVRLLEALGAGDADDRADALDDLADLSGAENLESVITRMLARDKSEEVRSVAAMGLESAEAPSTIDLLVDSLYDPSDAVREHARTTLGVIGTNAVRLRLKEERLKLASGDVRDIIDQVLEETFGEEVSLDDE